MSEKHWVSNTVSEIPATLVTWDLGMIRVCGTTGVCDNAQTVGSQKVRIMLIGILCKGVRFTSKRFKCCSLSFPSNTRNTFKHHLLIMHLLLFTCIPWCVPYCVQHYKICIIFGPLGWLFLEIWRISALCCSELWFQQRLFEWLAHRTFLPCQFFSYIRAAVRLFPQVVVTAHLSVWI